MHGLAEKDVCSTVFFSVTVICGLLNPVDVAAAPDSFGAVAKLLCFSISIRMDSVSGFVPVAPAGIPAYEDRLGRVRVPTLILWGENDSIVPVSRADQLEQLIEGSVKRILPGAPHPCYLEKTDEFHQALLEFLEELDR